MTYKITDSDTFEENDCVIILERSDTMPIITMTDEFINDTSIQTLDAKLYTPRNTLYCLNEDGDNILTLIGSISSIHRIENNIYFNTVTKDLITVFGISDIDAPLFKDRTLTLRYIRYSDIVPTVRDLQKRGTLSVNSTDFSRKLPATETMVDEDIVKITMDIPHIGFSPDGTNIYVGPSEIGRDASMIDFLGVSTSKIGWDVTSPVCTTIIRSDQYKVSTAYVGNIVKDILYIPIY